MASILDRYGIKEVADCTFYTIDEQGRPAVPVLYLDSLKVSTVEQTAESVYAQGGKGNPRLIGWDFGKEITLTLEDALFSPKSMSIMFGNGEVKSDSSYKIKKTITFTAAASGDSTAAKVPTSWVDANGKTQQIKGATYYDATGSSLTSDFKQGEKYFATFDVDTTAEEITIGPSTFPGTYYITGDTYARSEITGDDDYFQFIIPKGKVTSEQTITMEAEGDPSVFNMNVDVLRATDPDTGEHVMMRLVKYGLNAGE